MNEPLTLLTAFLLGFFGSVHCMGMCGGIVGALSFSTDKSSSSFKKTAIQLSYHLGRISTYGLLGLIAGLFGLWLAGSHEWMGIILRSIAGILLMLMGMYILGVQQSLVWLEKLGKGLWQKVQPLSKSLLPVSRPSQAFPFGLIWGLLPCGLLYSTLSWALVAADPLQSALLMMAFGLGNLPALLSFAAFTSQLTRLKQNPWVTTTMGLLIIGFGVWTVVASY